MSSRARWSRAALFLVAWSGLVGAHGLGYVVAIPDPHQRAHALAATGHGYWPGATGLAIAALVAAVAVVVGRRLRDPDGTLRAATAWRHLVPLQVIGFLLLEGLERAASGGGAEVVAGGAILAGVALQLLAAAIGAAMLRIADRVAAAVVRRRCSPFLSAPIVRWFTPAPAGPLPSTPRRDSASPRAPPLAPFAI